jgi:hypothetical protein
MSQHESGQGTEEEPRLSALILSALFQGDEITHFTHEYDKGLDEILPYLYCVLVRREGAQSISAGMIIKSTISNTQTPEFQEMATDCLRVSRPLAALADIPVRFLPARVKLEGTEPVTVEECLRILATQFYNHSRTPGHA